MVTELDNTSSNLRTTRLLREVLHSVPDNFFDDNPNDDLTAHDFNEPDYYTEFTDVQSDRFDNEKEDRTDRILTLLTAIKDNTEQILEHMSRSQPRSQVSRPTPRWPMSATPASPSELSPSLSHMSPSALLSTMPTTPAIQPTPQQYISSEKLFELKVRSTSCKNFAVNCLRELFRWEDLVGRNVLGVRSKAQVDPIRISLIRKYYFSMFPTVVSEQEKKWADCRKAIDEYIRRPVKRALQLNHRVTVLKLCIDS